MIETCSLKNIIFFPNNCKFYAVKIRVLSFSAFGYNDLVLAERFFSLVRIKR